MYAIKTTTKFTLILGTQNNIKQMLPILVYIGGIGS